MCGPVDQPGRSPALQAGGLGFKSRRVHKIFRTKKFRNPSRFSENSFHSFPCGPDGYEIRLFLHKTYGFIAFPTGPLSYGFKICDFLFILVLKNLTISKLPYRIRQISPKQKRIYILMNIPCFKLRYPVLA